VEAVVAKKEINLNIVSSYTHVSADTRRTTTVFIAAIISSITGISAAVVDAYAPVVVTGIILFVAAPLTYGIFNASYNLIYDVN